PPRSTRPFRRGWRTAWRKWGRSGRWGSWAENRDRYVGVSVCRAPAIDHRQPTYRHTDNRNVDVRSHTEERFHPMTTVAAPPREAPESAGLAAPVRRRNPIPL